MEHSFNESNDREEIMLDHQAIASVLLKDGKLHRKAILWFQNQTERYCWTNILQFDAIENPHDRAEIRTVSNYLRARQILQNYVRTYKGVLDADLAIPWGPISQTHLRNEDEFDMPNDPEELHPCFELCTKWLPVLRLQLEERLPIILQEYQVAHTICHQFLIKKQDPLYTKMSMDLFVFPGE